MFNNTDRNWERLAQRDAYYAVLTSDRFKSSNIDHAEFFQTGEDHIAHVFESLPNFRPHIALDVGCGVGRLLIPLSRVADRVVGFDVSPTMLEKARRNVDSRNIDNCQLVSTLSSVSGQIDFVHSYNVFQHIPIKRGERLFAELLRRLAPDGSGAVHFTFWQFVPSWRKVAARVTSASTIMNGLANLARGKQFGTPKMQMNCYSLNHILAMLHQHRCSCLSVEFVFDSPTLGAMIYFRKGLSKPVV